MISTKGKEVPQEKTFNSKYMNYGFNLASIEGYELKTASTGKIKVSFHMENTEPVEEGATYRGYESRKANNKYAYVGLGIYFDSEDELAINRLLISFANIADKTGKRKEVDAIQASTIEEYLKNFVNIVKGIPCWFKFKAEEYEQGKYNLSFAEYPTSENKVYCVFVEAEKDMIELKEEDGKQTFKYLKDGVTKVSTFDINSKFDYKKVDSTSVKDVRKKIVEDDNI